jgi:hypothetical protein
VFAVVKIYAISVEVSEIKETAARHQAQHRGSFAAHAESLIRAVHSSSYTDSGYPDSEVQETGDVGKAVAK